MVASYRRIVAVSAAATLGLGLTVCTPAHAVVSKSDSTRCPSGQHVVIAAKGSGVIQFYVSGSLRRTDDHGSVIYTSSYEYPASQASWTVTSTGYLEDAGTSAWCTAAYLAPR